MEYIVNAANAPGSKGIIQYQVVESKLKSNTLQVERFYFATINKEAEAEIPHVQ
jgi:hypothetical protein